MNDGQTAQRHSLASTATAAPAPTSGATTGNAFAPASPIRNPTLAQWVDEVDEACATSVHARGNLEAQVFKAILSASNNDIRARREGSTILLGVARTVRDDGLFNGVALPQGPAERRIASEAVSPQLQAAESLERASQETLEGNAQSALQSARQAGLQNGVAAQNLAKLGAHACSS